MNKILVLTVLAITYELASTCASTTSSECSKYIGKGIVKTNSTPEVTFIFNDVSNKIVDARVTIKKSSGSFGIFIVDSSIPNLKSGSSIQWKGGDNFVQETNSQWTITCFKVIDDTTAITFKIPVCDENFPQLPFNLEITIDSKSTTKHDTGSLNTVINNSEC